MKKPFDYTVLSTKTCINCGKKLKMNLVVKKPTANRYYNCYKKIKKY